MIDHPGSTHAVVAVAQPAVDPASVFERELLAGIPLARAMALSVAACEPGSLTLAAPLAPNINDKGCAFGGSLASAMTLAGWGLLKLALDARGSSADIYVGNSAIRYLAPVWQDFTAVARLGAVARFEDFFADLDRRGKAHVAVRCEVPLADGRAAATLAANFVAIGKR